MGRNCYISLVIRNANENNESLLVTYQIGKENKRIEILRVGQCVQKKQQLYTAGEHINWHNFSGRLLHSKTQKS